MTKTNRAGRIDRSVDRDGDDNCVIEEGDDTVREYDATERR